MEHKDIRIKLISHLLSGIKVNIIEYNQETNGTLLLYACIEYYRFKRPKTVFSDHYLRKKKIAPPNFF